MTKTKENKSMFFQIFGATIGGIIFWYILRLFIWWVPNLAQLLEYIKEPIQNSIRWKIVALIIFIIFSILLFKLKKKSIMIFGLLELVGGSWTIWATFSKNFDNNILYALAIGSGIFLLIKGLENVEKGNEENLKKSNKT
jgi:hypothetical protein